MKISIVTPSFNQIQFLERTILSIWNQQGDFDLEHIVADGGSKDGSVELLQKYDQLYRTGKHKYSCRSFSFQWWSCQDRGQSDAINRGFATSNGEFIGWLNSDDTYVNTNSLSSLLKPFLNKKADIDIVISNVNHIDENDHVLNIPCLINQLDNSEFQKLHKTLLRNNFILQPATLFRRSVWEHCSINEEYHYILDWIFWIEAQKKGYRFFKINEYTANNRLHRDAKTVEGGINKCAEGLSLFRQHNVWCLNRFYYYFYFTLLKTKRFPLLNKIVSFIIIFSKKIRVTLLNRFKLY